MSTPLPDRIVDVAVIGGGGAGLAAAIEARAVGRDVVLIEKNAELGGATAWSIGSVSANATPHQARRGIKDSPESHWRDMAAFNGDLDARDNPALRRILAAEMPDTLRWLLDHGVRFFGPMPEPPHTKPRMHNVLPNARAYIVHLERAARRLGVAIDKSTRAVELVVEGARVTGVDCEAPAGRRRYRARAVILATGDFTNDPELKGRFISAQAAKVEGVTDTATGDGQKLALKIGARIVNGDLALGPELRFVPPRRRNFLLLLPPWRALANFMAWSMDHMPGALLRPFVMSFVTTALAPSPTLFADGAILVNRRGERFADERAEPAFALPDQPERIGYILIDERIAGLYSAWPHFISTAPGVAYAYIDDYRRNRPDVYTAAASWEELAKKLGLAEGTLAKTVADHNAAAADRPRLAGGPYVALGPIKAVYVHNEGGLAVDGEHRVLGADEAPIPGLYAAGSTGQGGLLLKGHGHHLAWAFASGRRAGRIAAFASGD